MTPRLIRPDVVVTGPPQKKRRARLGKPRRKREIFRMNKKKVAVAAATVAQLQNLREELTLVRRRSLQATRQGDFMVVARCTAEAARLNRAIADMEGVLLDAGNLPSDYYEGRES